MYRLREHFDPEFYLAQNTDVATAGIDPFKHFLSHGWREERDPSSSFSVRHYIERFPEVAAADINPLQHWVDTGCRPFFVTELDMNNIEGKQRLHFDAEFYLEQNSDVAADGIDPFEHFIRYGWREHRNPSPRFSIKQYLKRFPEVSAAGINPLEHWIDSGSHELYVDEPDDQVSGIKRRPLQSVAITDEIRRKIRPYFDAAFYLAQNRDVAADGIDPLEHFLAFGWREERDPSSFFSMTDYVERFPKIAIDGVNPLEHWIDSGYQRASKPEGNENSTVPTPNSTVGQPLHYLSPDGVSDASLTRLGFDREDLSLASEFFDETYYRQANPNLDFDETPLIHYLSHGWRLGLNPSENFDTKFYLDRHPDLRTHDVNPLLHYVRHGRREMRESIPYSNVRKRNFSPLVSVIVPNYNHARYLEQRIRSILDQSYRNIELILLDDKSSDESVTVIEQMASHAHCKTTKIFNNANSGNVFSQWRKGLSVASGDLVWICESDDFAEIDFLERLVPHFADYSVMISFGRIQFCDTQGVMFAGLDSFRENAEPGIWSAINKRPAAQWFAGALGVNNVIANVGGCLFRRQTIADEIWREAMEYRIAGDWYLYSQIARGGAICYDPNATAYFRQHGQNESASNFDRLYYYQEHERILLNNAKLWRIPRRTKEKFVESIRNQYDHFDMQQEHGEFLERFPIYRKLEKELRTPHILIAMLSFTPGGGEIFPIHLANALVGKGYLVSLVVFNMIDRDEQIIEQVDKRIPIYHSSDVVMRGRNKFVEEVGVSVIHSHMVSLEDLFFNCEAPLQNFPYIVSLHGSYYGIEDRSPDLFLKFLRGVSHWVYTADKNLAAFSQLPLDHRKFSKIGNGMPADARPFPQTRSDLGIANDAVVFTFVARGIQQKGWRAAVTAFRRLRSIHPEIKAHLLMVGSGVKADEAYSLGSDVEHITFLGTQSRINGVYRISDCAIVPTRFDGESFPLCVIQALQEGLPIIATDIGEIKNMIIDEQRGIEAGLLIPNIRSSQEFFVNLYGAMLEMSNPNKRAYFKDQAAKLGQSYDIDDVANSYLDLYKAISSNDQTDAS